MKKFLISLLTICIMAIIALTIWYCTINEYAAIVCVSLAIIGVIVTAFRLIYVILEDAFDDD